MQYHTQSNSSFSMLFSMSNGDGAYDDGEMSSQYSSSSSVDCTLSLGTPSTRLSTNNDEYNNHQRSSFGWNTLPSSKHSPKPSSAKNHRGNGGDPLLARRCANCDTTSTPLWRNGPRGPKSLCNACGIRFKKEERRAAAAASNNGGAAAHMAVESQYVINNSSWVQPQKMPSYYNEYQYVEEYDCRDSETGIPYMSWLST